MRADREMFLKLCEEITGYSSTSLEAPPHQNCCDTAPQAWPTAECQPNDPSNARLTRKQAASGAHFDRQFLSS